jgi:hypothetical protein
MPRPGQVLGLVGTNGIGKSTALKVLAGKLKPNLGRFTVGVCNGCWGFTGFYKNRKTLIKIPETLKMLGGRMQRCCGAMCMPSSCSCLGLGLGLGLYPRPVRAFCQCWQCMCASSCTAPAGP